MNRPIALLTDFGTTDTYVGVMKAVMRHIYPQADFIDLTHSIQPQNVSQAAFTLLNSYRYFPPGTIFLSVVDPDVGISARKAIAVQAGDYTFVAPDNGLLSYTVNGIGTYTAIQLANPAYQLMPVSHTFHGRDIFAPAAAYLASGVDINQLGSKVERITQQITPQLEITDTEIFGEVVHIDHFGNIITSIGQWHWQEANQIQLIPRFGTSTIQPTVAPTTVSINIKNQSILAIRRTYAEGAKGQLIALIGSSSYLEIAVNQGSAVSQLGVSVGAPVTINKG